MKKTLITLAVLVALGVGAYADDFPTNGLKAATSVSLTRGIMIEFPHDPAEQSDFSKWTFTFVLVPRDEDGNQTAVIDSGQYVARIRQQVGGTNMINAMISEGLGTGTNVMSKLFAACKKEGKKAYKERNP